MARPSSATYARSSSRDCSSAMVAGDDAVMRTATIAPEPSDMNPPGDRLGEGEIAQLAEGNTLIEPTTSAVGEFSMGLVRLRVADPVAPVNITDDIGLDLTDCVACIRWPGHR